jgi:hypothetical protein
VGAKNQLIVLPVEVALRLEELPVQILAGVAVADEIVGSGFTTTAMLPEPPLQQPVVLFRALT